MIKLLKIAEPEIVEIHGEQWTEDFVALKAAGGTDAKVESRHRHAAIKTALFVETNDKCAYCEEKIRSSQHGDVEHIDPKSLHPDRYLVWENLTIACAICNNKKRDHTGLINPYVDEPDQHLAWCGPLVSPSPGSFMGSLTVRCLGLNRTELLLKRSAKIAAIMNLFELMDREVDDAVKQVILEDIMSKCEKTEEFSAASYHYIEFRERL